MRAAGELRYTALALCAGLLGACAQSGPAPAPKPAVAQPAPQAVQVARAEPAVKRIDPMADIAGDVPLPALKGAGERIDCSTGTDDKHRLGIEARGGQVTYFAYYNKWQLRTCSLEFARNAPGTKWRQTPDGATRVHTPQGRFVIRAVANAYELEFQDVSRRSFCSSGGWMNGTMTIGRGARNRACSTTGFANTGNE